VKGGKIRKIGKSLSDTTPSPCPAYKRLSNVPGEGETAPTIDRDNRQNIIAKGMFGISSGSDAHTLSRDGMRKKIPAGTAVVA